MVDEVDYLGMKISRHGISPIEEKVEAIKQSPAPENVSQLRSFLGMITYYQGYIYHLSSQLNPLHKLLKKGQKWVWETAQQNAFENAKKMLSSDTLLVHYDSTKELILSCDASPYGLGVVLSHLVDGNEVPIAYASRSLTMAEKNYSHLEKEALAIIFGVRKFHQYCYGRHIKIQTDHKPLIGILAENKQIPAMTAARLQRWALLLAAYDYELWYRAGKYNGNADALSRLPLKRGSDWSMAGILDEGDGISDVLMMELDRAPVNSADVKLWSIHDTVIGTVIKLVQEGWDTCEVTEELKPYVTRKDELSVTEGCLLWGSRIIVPKKGRGWCCMNFIKVIQE